MSLAILARKNESAGSSKASPPSMTASSGLRIGEPNTAFEQEADRVADEIMASSAPRLHWSLAKMSIGIPPSQRKRDCVGSSKCDEREEDGTVQRKAAGYVQSNEAPAIVHEVLRSPGRQLDRVARDFFEPRFGHDLGKIRIHTGSAASISARSVNAVAYTVGNHLVFDEGRYAPHEGAGRELLAHELAHSIQQGEGSSFAGRLEIGEPRDSYESQADAAAEGVNRGGKIAGLENNSSGRLQRLRLQRQPQPAARSLLDDITWVIESRYEHGGLNVIHATGDRINNSIVDMFVTLGEQSHENCSNKITELELFDKGAEIFARRFHFEKRLSNAAARGTRAGERTDAATRGLYEVFLNGQITTSMMTKKEHEAYLDAKDQAKLFGFQAWSNLVASMGFSAGSEGASGESGGGEGSLGELEPLSAEPPPREPLPKRDPAERPPEPDTARPANSSEPRVQADPAPSRSNESEAAGAGEPIFTLGVGKDRLERIQSGEKNFVVDRRLTFDIDEVLPVGARDIKPQRAVGRATSASNRQLLDPNTNQRTKGLGIDPRELPRNRPALKPLSVSTDPNILLTRRFSEVHELQRIFDRAVASVKEPQKLTPTRLKARINAETRRIITEDTGPDAAAVRKALGDLGFERRPGIGWVMTDARVPQSARGPAQ
jgi:Domain of unknown function (DUF4157)